MAQWLTLMVIDMEDFSLTINDKERELYISLMVVDTRGILKMINVMDLESISLLMETYVSKKTNNR